MPCWFSPSRPLWLNEVVAAAAVVEEDEVAPVGGCSAAAVAVAECNEVAEVVVVAAEACSAAEAEGVVVSNTVGEAGALEEGSPQVDRRAAPAAVPHRWDRMDEVAAPARTN